MKKYTEQNFWTDLINVAKEFYNIDFKFTKGEKNQIFKNKYPKEIENEPTLNQKENGERIYAFVKGSKLSFGYTPGYLSYEGRKVIINLKDVEKSIYQECVATGAFGKKIKIVNKIVIGEDKTFNKLIKVLKNIDLKLMKQCVILNDVNFYTDNKALIGETTLEIVKSMMEEKNRNQNMNQALRNKSGIAEKEEFKFKEINVEPKILN